MLAGLLAQGGRPQWSVAKKLRHGLNAPRPELSLYREPSDCWGLVLPCPQKHHECSHLPELPLASHYHVYWWWALWWLPLSLLEIPSRNCANMECGREERLSLAGRFFAGWVFKVVISLLLACTVSTGCPDSVNNQVFNDSFKLPRTQNRPIGACGMYSMLWGFPGDQLLRHSICAFTFSRRHLEELCLF